MPYNNTTLHNLLLLWIPSYHSYTKTSNSLWQSNTIHDENIPVTAGPPLIQGHWGACLQLVYVDLITSPHHLARGPLWAQLVIFAILQEMDIHWHNHILYKNMWNQNFNSVCTWIFTKVKRTYLRDAFCRGTEWEAEWPMQAWYDQWCVKWRPSSCNSEVLLMLWHRSVLTHLPLDKMAAILVNDIFKCIFLNERTWISIKISLKFVVKGPINKIPALVQIMAWRRPGDKPLSEPMLTQFTDA